MSKYYPADVFSPNCDGCQHLKCKYQHHVDPDCDEMICKCWYDENAYDCPKIDDEDVVERILEITEELGRDELLDLLKKIEEAE